MSNDTQISHEGIVQSIDGQNIAVKLTVQSACAGCHAKNICGAADSSDKVVTARNLDDGTFEIGEKVRVEIGQSLATKAIVICYLLPFIVLLASFCISSYLIHNELICVAITFGCTILYYFFVWLFHSKIERKATFHITKLPKD